MDHDKTLLWEQSTFFNRISDRNDEAVRTRTAIGRAARFQTLEVHSVVYAAFSASNKSAHGIATAGPRDQMILAFTVTLELSASGSGLFIFPKNALSKRRRVVGKKVPCTLCGLGIIFVEG